MLTLTGMYEEVLQLLWIPQPSFPPAQLITMFKELKVSFSPQDSPVGPCSQAGEETQQGDSGWLHQCGRTGT